LPITRPPIRGGAIHLRGNTIEYVGQPLGGEVDLGEVVLFPAWVNLHTHLDLSDCRDPLGESGEALPSWLGKVIGHRRQRAQVNPRAASDAAALGVDELRHTGTRLFVDIASDGSVAQAIIERSRAAGQPDAFPSEAVAPRGETAATASITAIDPFEPYLLGETLGLSLERQQLTWRQAIDVQRAALAAGLHGGLSPHAPYSTTIGTVDQACRAAKAGHFPVAMHLAESWQEQRLLEKGDGPIRDRLEAIGVWQDGLFPCPDYWERAIELLARAPIALLVHANYLHDRHRKLLAGRSQITVVYCPRTHARFGHPPHPLAELLSAGVRVGLGTDSRASNPDLDLWGEVRFLFERRPDLTPQQVMAAATWHGAAALRREDCGQFVVGACPGVLVLPTDDRHDAYAGIAASRALPVPLHRFLARPGPT
jgi:cytosine/adenosine deaminase-related metal-dependent hydrolase